MKRLTSAAAAIAVAVALGPNWAAPAAQAGELSMSPGVRVTWVDSDLVEPRGCQGYTFQWTNAGPDTIFWFYVGWLGYGRAMGQFSRLAINGTSGTGTIVLCDNQLFNGLGPYNTFIISQPRTGGSLSVEGEDNFWFKSAISAPSAPSNVAAVPGSGSATVSWRPPANDGGSPVSGYTVTSVPSSAGCTSTLPYCVVHGLTNGVPYTFTVTATNEAGASSPSAPSIPVTPREPVSLSLSCRAVTGPMASCSGQTNGVEPGTALTVQTKVGRKGPWRSVPQASRPLVTAGGTYFWRSSTLKPGVVSVRVGHGGKWSNTATVRLG